VHAQLHRDARVAGLAYQRLDVGGPGLWLAPDNAVAADQAQDCAHLADRLQARGPDGPERLAGLARVAVDELLAHTGLEDQHAETVRHDVMQFPGDALPLGLGGRLGPFGLVPLCRAGLPLGGDHPLVPPPGGQPDTEEQLIIVTVAADFAIQFTSITATWPVTVVWGVLVVSFGSIGVRVLTMTPAAWGLAGLAPSPAAGSGPSPVSA
jgi:hypothetical protein